jgi:hypothetical protein
MAYTFDKDVSIPDYEIKIDTKAEYGYFEHNEHGASGGMWLDTYMNNMHEKILVLVDYDGVTELPMRVRAALLGDGILIKAVEVED